MLNRGLNFALNKYKAIDKKAFPTHNEWTFIDVKPDPSLLRLDSSGKEVYGW